jgi:hypothetical protein
MPSVRHASGPHPLPFNVDGSARAGISFPRLPPYARLAGGLIRSVLAMELRLTGGVANIAGWDG